MLSHLGVRHFATVDTLALEPGPGLTAISGETGAGKSIIIDALGLALGERADSAVVRPGCERAEVEATFDLHDCPAARAWLVARELDQDDDCILRRTVRADGRSRAWINGTAVPLTDVRELGQLLISIHSQHEHQSLLRNDAQRALLDSFAGNEALLRQLGNQWRQWRQARDAHEQALSAARELGERQELLRFQLEELDAFALGEQELAELETEQKRLANAEQLIRLCQQSLDMLYAGEEATVSDQLSRTEQWLGEAMGGDDSLNPVLASVESARLQVEAAAEDLRHYLDRLDLDPARLQQVEERLDQAYTLARKHRVRAEDLYQHHRALTTEASQLAHHDQHLQALELAEREAEHAFQQSAAELGERRRQHAGKLARGVLGHLKLLGMPGARLEVLLQATQPGPSGLEEVQFQFTANPGQPLRPLARVASGGELSRISLAIQVICARSLTVPSLVFDEVDVGVGGGIAEIVGRLLRELGEHAQVLCITHQPQVASLGHRHWQVLKAQSKTSTRTEVLALDQEQRVAEVARMLGGVEITESTLAHAREMVVKSQAATG